jgi:hypothetical protein
MSQQKNGGPLSSKGIAQCVESCSQCVKSTGETQGDRMVSLSDGAEVNAILKTERSSFGSLTRVYASVESLFRRATHCDCGAKE